MGVSISGGGLDFESTLDNSDFQSKSLEDLRLIKLRLELTGDTSGITKYDQAVKSALATETKLRADLAKIIADARNQARDFANDTVNSETKNIDLIEKETDALRKRNAEFKEGSTIPSSPTGLFEVGSDAPAIGNTVGSLNPDTQKLLDLQIQVTEATKNATAAIAEEEITLQGLKTQLKELQSLQLTTPIEGLPALNEEIQLTEIKIREFTNIGKEGFNELGESIRAIAPDFEYIEGSIGQLKQQIAQLNAEKINLTGPALQQTNATIQNLEGNLKQLNNVGKEGFDSFGNALESTEQKAGKFGAAIDRATNLSNIGATIVSRLSRQIIGLGVGLISITLGAKAIEALVDYIKNLDAFTGRLDQAKQNLIALNEVQKSSAEIAGKQIGNLELEYKAATDVNRSMAERLAAAQSLRDEYPTEFQNATNLAIVNGQLRNSYDDLAKSILKSAEAAAASTKAQEIAGKIIDVEQQKVDLAARTKLALANAKLLPTSSNNPNIDAIINPQSDRIKQINEGNKAQLDDLNKQLAVYDGVITSLSKYVGDISKRSKDLNDANKLLGANLENFNDVLAKSTDKTQLDNIKNALQTKLNSLAPNDAQIATIRADLQKVDDLEKQYQVKATKAPKGDPLISQGNTLLAERTKILNQIDALKDKTGSKDKTRDEQEQDAIKATYKAQLDNITALNKKRQEFIDKYNKLHKTNGGAAYADSIGLKKVDSTPVTDSETNALAGLAGDQSLEQTKVVIEKEKSLFKEYEDFKLQAGTDAANKLYGNQTKGFDNYLDYLKSLQPTEAELTSADPYIKARASAMSDYLKKAIPDAEIQIQSETVKLLAQYILQTQTFEDKKKEIISKTNDEVAVLVKAGFLDQAVIAQQLGDAQLQQLVIQQKEQLESYKGLSDSIVNLTASQAALRIEQAKNTLELNKSKLSAEDYAKALGLIKEAEDQISVNTIVQGLGALSSVFNQISQSTSSLDKNLSDSFKSIADFLGSAGSLTGGIKDLTKALTNFKQNQADATTAAKGSSFLGTVSTIADMIPIAGTIISAGVKIVSGVINFFKAASATAKASAQELLDYQVRLTDSAIVYNELLRDRARAQDDITTLTEQELKAREQMLTDQKNQAQADYNTLLSQIQSSGQFVSGEHTEKYGGFLGIGQKTKVVQDLSGLSSADYDTLEKLYTEGKLTDSTKTWFEELKNVHDELGDIGVSTQEAADQLNKIATGTTADDIANAIVDGFKAGKRSAADFADDFQSLMQNAALSVFQADYLQGKIDDFYQDFAAASASDGGLTAEKIALLKQQYAQIIADSSAQITDLEKVVGPIDSSTGTTTGSTNNFNSAIKGVTSDQIDFLEGQFGGMRIAQVSTLNEIITSNALNKQMLDYAVNNLSYIIKIEANTYRTANNTDVLKDINTSLASIDKKTGAPSSSLIANGKTV